jgi:hypothetical protein
MVDDQTEQHRDAYRAVMAVVPGSKWISHDAAENPDWETPVVKFPIVITLDPRGCPTCGEPGDAVGLTQKCRDWHEVCKCGERYDRPKGKGCRRRKHVKEVVE